MELPLKAVRGIAVATGRQFVTIIGASDATALHRMPLMLHHPQDTRLSPACLLACLLALLYRINATHQCKPLHCVALAAITLSSLSELLFLC